MSGGGGNSQPSVTTQTTTSEPWEAQKAPLERGFQRAEDLYQSDVPQYFPDSTVTPFSPESQMAMGAGAQRAIAGNPLLAQGQQQQSNTIGGQYTDPTSNPFYKNLIDSSVAAVRPGIDSMFNMGNRAGSPGHAEALGRGFGNAFGPQLFQDYGRERGLQQQAAQNAPAMAQADYYDIDKLGQIGAQREGKSGNVLQDLINRFNFGQTVDQNKLAQFMQTVGGAQYGVTTNQQSTQPTYGK